MSTKTSILVLILIIAVATGFNYIYLQPYLDRPWPSSTIECGSVPRCPVLIQDTLGIKRRGCVFDWIHQCNDKRDTWVDPRD